MPKFVVLDSSTLGKISADYWSEDEKLRDKSRRFLRSLASHGFQITFAYSHLCELLRHENEQIVRSRMKFLRSLPLIAWVRPYDRNWFPGAPVDLLRRELHAVVHEGARTWPEIVEAVRADLFETGTGEDLFVDNDAFWDVLRRDFRSQLDHERYIASIARTTPGYLHDLKLCEMERLPMRLKSERAAFMRWFVNDLQTQLERHADKRVTEHRLMASHFAENTIRQVETFEAAGGDPIQQMLKDYGVPTELLRPEMTIGELGELAVYIKQLQLISEDLRPSVQVTVRDVPPETLPSYEVQHRLSRLQKLAPRVSGSDHGDGYLAMLVLYADAVEVDKRTFEYLQQVLRGNSGMKSLVGQLYRASDYSNLESQFGLAGQC
jgi:hypothetical protein